MPRLPHNSCIFYRLYSNSLNFVQRRVYFARSVNLGSSTFYIYYLHYPVKFKPFYPPSASVPFWHLEF
ncbi:hypothetical protein BDZ91DRAFT_709558 [Kalaharituber pfeilii]|nr:hypothetical protein BDZ91DRAFT_709558 [Kalaharituber pfeilii]